MEDHSKQLLPGAPVNAPVYPNSSPSAGYPAPQQVSAMPQGASPPAYPNASGYFQGNVPMTPQPVVYSNMGSAAPGGTAISIPISAGQPTMRPSADSVLAISIFTCVCCFCCGGLFALVLAILSRNDLKPGPGTPDPLTASILNRVAWGAALFSLFLGTGIFAFYVVYFFMIILGFTSFSRPV